MLTPAKLQELARQAGAIRLIDAAGAKRKTPWSLTDAALTKFAGLIQAAVLEEAAEHFMEMHAQASAHNYWQCAANEMRALAQQAGGEPPSQGTIPADRRRDADEKG